LSHAGHEIRALGSIQGGPPLTAARRFQTRHRIRFSECDPAGLVFYPQYFVLFNDLLEAWVDTLVSGGFAGYVGLRRYGLPTVHLEAEFKAISRMGDDVTLSLEVVRLGTKSLTLALACTGPDGQRRMSAMQTVVTTSLETHTAIAIPEELRRALDGPTT
jgi:4-hydroxybenzoyl-CoA thioesterase